MSFEILPAIDLRGGRVVRLLQGDYARQTEYPDDPLALAARYAADGARWLHLVDLDGAREGAFASLDMLRALAASGLSVQAGGGVRDASDVGRLLDAGAARVVIGSIAVREPARVERWLRDFGTTHIVIALDTRWRDGEWRLPSAGWTREEAVELRALARRYAEAGARHVLSTDIARDGTLAGPNLDLYRELSEWQPGLSVQASGGVRGVDDVRALRDSGAAGAILGRALLEGRLTVAEVLAC